MVQVLGLATMIGVLAQNNKLEDLLQQLPPESERSETTVTSLLTTLVMEVIETATQDGTLYSANGMIEWRSRQDGELIPLNNIGGYDVNNTLFLLKIASERRARHQFIKAYTKIPAFGWPVLLIIMWTHLFALSEP